MREAAVTWCHHAGMHTRRSRASSYLSIRTASVTMISTPQKSKMKPWQAGIDPIVLAGA
jgi:hypothetical protein